MGTWCHLTNWSSDDAAPDTSLESKNQVPIVWLAMFDPEDIHDRDTSGPDVLWDQLNLYLVADGARAVARLSRRTEALAAALGHRELLTEFTRFAQVFVGQRVILQLDAFVEDHEPGRFARSLRKNLQLLGDPATPADQLLELSGLSPDGGQPYAENILIGWGTELTERERERTSEKDQLRQRWHEHVRPFLTPPSAYSLTATYHVGDFIEHSKHGLGQVSKVREGNQCVVDFAAGPEVLDHAFPPGSPYEPTSRYAVGDIIEHPRFGSGRVVSTYGPASPTLSVQFADKHRSVLHGVTPLPYTTTRQYQTGDVIEHPTHGVGLVSDMMRDHRMAVTFDDRRRALVHGVPEAVPYAPSSPYRVGDRIEHPRFGTGMVQALLDNQRMEVLFTDGPRKLVRGA